MMRIIFFRIRCCAAHNEHYEIQDDANVVRIDKRQSTLGEKGRKKTRPRSVYFPGKPLYITTRSMMNTSMDLPEYLREITEFTTVLPGTMIRRLGTGKTHQGSFAGVAPDAAGVILADVIDLENRAYLAESGLVRFAPTERFFGTQTPFHESAAAESALLVVTEWVLFREHPQLQGPILSFVKSVYAPEQIVELKQTDALPALFVPIQQKFKIGRFTEKIDYAAVRRDRFRGQLDDLGSGKHITYVAFIPNDTNHEPLFYSLGTKPHQETTTQLGREMYAFRPTNGGHIKAVFDAEGKRHFVVDAGSNYLGAGMNTPLAIAENVVEALHRVYTNFDFVAVPGRDAFGVQQSY